MTKISSHKFDFLKNYISNDTTYVVSFLEAKQPTQATTIENLKYELTTN